MKRHLSILKFLETNNYVSVQHLCETFKVSAVTIRKDLKLLEKKGLLFRTHGGASSHNPYIKDRHVNEKVKINVAEKEAITKEALKLIKPNDSIMIASGTTMQMLAKKIQLEHQLSITTSSLNVALELTKSPYYEVLQLGGMVRHSSSSVNGHFSHSLLENITCNLLFLGVDGIDIDYGCTTTSLDEAILNQKMIKSAQKVILLADSSKFEKKGFGKICALTDVDQIITDNKVSEKIINRIKELGVELKIAL